MKIKRIQSTPMTNRGAGATITIPNDGKNCTSVFLFSFIISAVDFTSVTYGGIVVTELMTFTNLAGHVVSIWGLNKCKNGVQNMVITNPSGADVIAGLATYTGVNNINTFPDTFNSGTNLLSSLAVSATTTKDNCVLLGIGTHEGLAADALSPGANTSFFGVYNVSGGLDSAMIESSPFNTGVAGSKSLEVTLGTGGQQMGLGLLALSPSLSLPDFFPFF